VVKFAGGGRPRKRVGEMMSGSSHVGEAYRKYFSINGRARRAEYFTFLFYVVGVTVGLMAGDLMAFGTPPGAVASMAGVFFFGHLVPLITVFVRRLHDCDEDIPMMLVPVWVVILAGTGLMTMFGLATVFGLVFITFGQLLCLQVLRDPGTTGGNRFGPAPETGAEGRWHDQLAMQPARSREVYRVRH
jgi:uncharacterized membrane protein YhaH (DUF805 family)